MNDIDIDINIDILAVMNDEKMILVSMVSNKLRDTIEQLLLQIQLNPALTDSKGPIILFCYRWNSVIAHKGYLRKQVEGTIDFHLLHVVFRCW